MSDLSANQPVAGEVTPAAEPAAGLPPEGEITEFTPEYVGRLRDEAAGYRTKLNPFEEAYAGYDENEVATLLEVAKVLKADPVAAAEWFENAAREIKGVVTPVAPAPVAAPVSDDGDRPLTRAEALALWQEQQTTAAAEKAKADDIAAIDREVTELGYDPTDSWGLRLMQLAAYQTGGDLKAASEIVAGEKQKIIDDYVAQLAAQGGVAGVTTPGGIPSGEKQIKTMADSEAAMRERLARVM